MKYLRIGGISKKKLNVQKITYYSNDVVIDNRVTCHPLHTERYAEEFNLTFQGHHNFKKLLRNDLF